MLGVVTTACCSIKFACTLYCPVSLQANASRVFPRFRCNSYWNTYDWTSFDNSLARCKPVLHSTAENRFDLDSTRLPLWRKDRSPL